jgi:hypothetical protein
MRIRHQRPFVFGPAMPSGQSEDRCTPRGKCRCRDECQSSAAPCPVDSHCLHHQNSVQKYDTVAGAFAHCQLPAKAGRWFPGSVMSPRRTPGLRRIFAACCRRFLQSGESVVTGIGQGEEAPLILECFLPLIVKCPIAFRMSVKETDAERRSFLQGGCRFIPTSWSVAYTSCSYT